MEAPPPPFPWGFTPEAEHYALKGVRHERRFISSSSSARNLQLFTQSWSPLHRPPRALLFMVHGYGNDSSWMFQNTAILFAQLGMAAFALDLEGHGRSEGVPGFLPDLDAAAEDCLAHFLSVKERAEHSQLPCFLYGESMGGAICILLHFKAALAWDGAILVAPMCKLSQAMLQQMPWPVVWVLKMMLAWFPQWAIVPTKDLVDVSVKDPAKRELGRRNPRRYAGKPRLGTVAALLNATSYIEKRLQDVDLPFLVLHGDADVVTDPSISQALYELAKSQDKRICIYPGMMHSLLQGEPDENVATILSDISSWLDDHIAAAPRSIAISPSP
jgi:acylglycerol lipase